jgi:uncharacterized membrane protein
MDKRVGFVFILIALIVGATAVADKMNTEQLITEYQNRTGTCFIGGTCLHAQTSMTFIILSVIVGVIFVIGVLIIFLSIRDKKIHKEHKKEKEEERRKPEKRTERKLSLTAEQKKIYDILLDSDGSMLQGELVEKSGLNKVTVSRILDKLEMQNIIERRRHGMSNIVVVKKQ